MNNTTSYTPLESLFLFQSLLQYGIEYSTFARISDLLKNNSLVQQEESYDAARLTPDALRELFLRLLQEELRDEADQVDSPSSGISQSSRKRKIQSPTLPTLKDAREHLEKLPVLVDRLYARYRDYILREIRNDEDKIEKLRLDLGRLQANERKSVVGDDDGSEAAPNGPPAQDAQKGPKLTNGARSPAPIVLPPLDVAAKSPVPTPRYQSPTAQPSALAPQPAAVSSIGPSAALATDPKYSHGAESLNGVQQPPPKPDVGATIPQPKEQRLRSITPAPDRVGTKVSSPHLPKQEPTHIRWESPYSPQPVSEIASSVHPPPQSLQEQLQQPLLRTSLHTPLALPLSAPLQAPPGVVPQLPQTSPISSRFAGPVQPQLAPPAPMHGPLETSQFAQPTTQHQSAAPPQDHAAQPEQQAGDSRLPGTPGSVPLSQWLSSSQGPLRPGPLGQTAQGYYPPTRLPIKTSALNTPHRVLLGDQASASPSGVNTPIPASRQAASAPFTPTPALHSLRRLSIPKDSGFGTRWTPEITPSTPRPEVGEMPRPNIEPLSPTLPPADVAAVAPSASERSDDRRKASKQAQRLEMTVGRPRGRPPRSAPKLGKSNSTSALAAPRRSQSIVSQPDELSMDHEDTVSRKVKEEESTTPRPVEEAGDTTAEESVPSRRKLMTPSYPPVRLTHKRKREDTPPEHRPPPPGPPTHVLWTRSFTRVSSSALEQISGHRHANMFAHPIKEGNAPGYPTIVLHPQDLKSIRMSITAGNKAAVAAAQALPGGDPGTSVVWLPISEELVPPKGIINSAQLERELLHMFTNAIMYNPDPNRGPGPAFKRGPRGESGSGGADAGGDDGGHRHHYHHHHDGAGVGADGDALGYEVDENGVVKATRNMYLEAKKVMADLRSAEKGRVGDVGPPPPPSAPVPTAGFVGAAVSSSVDMAPSLRPSAQDDGNASSSLAQGQEAPTTPLPPTPSTSAAAPTPIPHQQQHLQHDEDADELAGDTTTDLSSGMGTAKRRRVTRGPV